MKPGMAPGPNPYPPAPPKAKVSPEKGKKSQEPFVGWKGAAFVLRTPSGLKQRMMGPHSSIVATLRKTMPAWYKVAMDKGHIDFAAAILAEAMDLGIEIPPYKGPQRLVP